MRIPEPPLLLITDRKEARGSIIDVVRAALSAGCRWVSIREKDLPTSEQQSLVQETKLIAAPFNAKVTLHGDPSVAVAARADGVHLAAGSDVVSARKIIGSDALLGLSVHSGAEVRNIDPRIVDYVVAGPVFETRSKPGYGPALGLESIQRLVSSSPVPVIAIGGIGPENAGLLLEAKVAGLAVMGGVMRSPDPAAEIRAILNSFGSGA